MTTCEVVIIRDADLEYNPKEYPLLSGAAEFAAVTYRAIRDRNELKTPKSTSRPSPTRLRG